MSLAPDSAHPAAAPRRIRLTSAAREQQLLDVAEELFTERGYEGVSVEDIAQAAGVSRPIVYQHHGSKDGIFLACVERARRALQRELGLSLQGRVGLDAQAEAGGRVFFEMAASDRARWALLFTSSASLNGPLSDRLAELRLKTITELVQWVQPYLTSIPEPDLYAFAFAVSGVGEQLGRWWLQHPEITLDQVVLHYRTMVGGMACAMLPGATTVAVPA